MPAQPSFTSAPDVDNFFTTATGRDFVSWFSRQHAGKGAWDRTDRYHAGVIQSLDEAMAGCREVCDNLPAIFGRPATLDEFLCLSSVIINETASFRPVTERVGTNGHPGIAYAFDAIPGLKQSYNQAPLNRLAGDLFRDPEFLAAHGQRRLADRVRNTTDPRWNGTVYPQADFPTSREPNESGIILEADFFKFRGRGLIQTTFRANYLPLIAFIQSSDSSQPVMREYRQAWRGLDPDIVATRSSNDDWDRLFQQTDSIVAAAAVRIHSARNGNYLQISADDTTSTSEDAGSAFMVGRRVSGRVDYARLFRDRVLQLRNDLPPFLPDNTPYTPPTVSERRVTHSVTADWWTQRTIPQSPDAGDTYTMQATLDFELPQGVTRLRFGVYAAEGDGYLRFFNADGSEAEPAGWGTKPSFSTVEVVPRTDGTVAFRVEDGPITTERVRSLAYWR